MGQVLFDNSVGITVTVDDSVYLRRTRLLCLR